VPLSGPLVPGVPLLLNDDPHGSLTTGVLGFPGVERFAPPSEPPKWSPLSFERVVELGKRMLPCMVEGNVALQRRPANWKSGIHGDLPIKQSILSRVTE
jgi:hypothetical protein